MTALTLSAAFLAISLLGCLLFPHYLPAALLYEIAVIDLIIRDQLTQWFPSFNQSWWHEICPGLYLGGIPLVDLGHLKKIQELKVQSILAILEEEEANAETIFCTPVRQADWEEASINYRRLSCPDMHAMKLEEIENAIEWIDQNISRGVYVHCKAGRGRSPMIIISYLIRYHAMEYKEALCYLSKVRSVIRFRPCQLERMKEFAVTK